MEHIMQPANETEYVSSWDDENNFELYTLAWLDENIDSMTEKTEKQRKLRGAVSTLRMYCDIDVFKQWMKRREGRHEKVIFVTSQCTARKILSEIHNYKHLSAIYMYDTEQESSEPWSEDYQKICSIKGSLDEVIEQIHKDQPVRQKVEDVDFFSITNSRTGPGRSSSYLNGDFLWGQTFIEALLVMERQATDLNEMIELCTKISNRNKNQTDLKTIEDFSLYYSPENALRWYTHDSCFYRILNQALRTQDISTLIGFRSFIRDLYVQLQQLQSDADPTSISRVYRSQIISREELDELKAFIGGYISLNSFLSTSLDPEMALCFISGTTMTENQLQPVLFIIDILSSIQNTKPFANISLYSNMPGEDEVLFMLGSVFKVCSIKKDDSKWVVILELASASDNELNHLLEYGKKDLSDKSDFISLGEVLLEMGKYDKAKICAEYKLDQLNKTEPSPLLIPQFAECYELLAKAVGHLENYDLAIEYFQKQLELCESGPFHIIGPLFIHTYQNIAKTYTQKGDAANAAIYNEKAEAMQKKVFYDNGIDRAETFLHNGVMYCNQELYEDAITNYVQALSVFEQCLPSNHHQIATTLTLIGHVYKKQLEFETAIDYYLRADKIYSGSLTSTHHHLKRVRENVEYVTYEILRQNVGAYYEVAQYYMDNGQFEDALHHYKEALFILKQRFPSNHYVIGETLMTIARTYAEIAKLHHVSIENCPNMIKCRPVDHENIIQYLSQAQQILLQNVAPTHPDLLFIYGAIELSQSFLESASVSEG